MLAQEAEVSGQGRSMIEINFKGEDVDALCKVTTVSPHWKDQRNRTPVSPGDCCSSGCTHSEAAELARAGSLLLHINSIREFRLPDAVINTKGMSFSLDCFPYCQSFLEMPLEIDRKVCLTDVLSVSQLTPSYPSRLATLKWWLLHLLSLHSLSFSWILQSNASLLQPLVGSTMCFLVHTVELFQFPWLDLEWCPQFLLYILLN